MALLPPDAGPGCRVSWQEGARCLNIHAVELQHLCTLLQPCISLQRPQRGPVGGAGCRVAVPLAIFCAGPRTPVAGGLGTPLHSRHPAGTFGAQHVELHPLRCGGKVRGMPRATQSGSMTCLPQQASTRASRRAPSRRRAPLACPRSPPPGRRSYPTPRPRRTCPPATATGG